MNVGCHSKTFCNTLNKTSVFTQNCDFGKSNLISPAHFVISQLFVSSILPYLIPFALMGKKIIESSYKFMIFCLLHSSLPFDEVDEIVYPVGGGATEDDFEEQSHFNVVLHRS